MDVQLVDVTVHVDQNLDPRQRDELESSLRSVAGVISVHMPRDKPHLLMIEYDPDNTTSRELLTSVTKQGVRAELIGL